MGFAVMEPVSEKGGKRGNWVRGGVEQTERNVTSEASRYRLRRNTSIAWYWSGLVESI
jgi:hypothetical protein